MNEANEHSKLDKLIDMLQQQAKQLEFLQNQLTDLQRKVSLMGPIPVKHSFLQRWLRPRLGNLYQYQPTPMRLPKHYYQPISLAQPAPLISIVTPSYQQGQYIERTIQSVLGQNYPSLEYYVQDGGSRDSTVEILKKYADRLSGYASLKDNGQSHAINLGFARTQGEIMAWLNSDDLLLPNSLSRVAQFFQQNPDIDVVYGHRILIDENDQEIGRWVLPAHDDKVMVWADYIPQETLFWRRRLWDKVGGSIDESFKFAMDWDLLLRFRKAGAKFARLPHFMGAFRIHEAQKTSAQISAVGVVEMNRLRERELGYVPCQFTVRRHVLGYLLRVQFGDDLRFRFLRFFGLNY